jgi:hypothetical protein
MRKMMKNVLQMITAALLLCTTAMAQNDDSPVAVLDKINKQIELVNQKYMVYMSEMAHGRRAKKAVKRHQELLQQIDNAKYALVEIPYYKGDRSLHESTKAYLNLIGNLQRENYSKVVNMEEIAEQSYDAMEAYLLFKRKINEKMDDADKERQKLVEDYCKKNNITLVEGPETEKDKKMKAMGEVIDYHETLYLIFFKASIHDEQLIDAMNENNLTAVEQIRNSLKKYSLEGLTRLDTIKSYRGTDATLKNACKRALDFFKKEAEMIDAFSDYKMKEEAFNTIKKNFERNTKAQSDKAEVAKYNAAVEDINKALQKYNQTNEQLNKQRSEVIKNWNDAESRFFDTNIPYAK